jgi:hypothetical protein
MDWNVFKGYWASNAESEFVKNRLDELQSDEIWHMNGAPMARPYVLALGRSCYYLAFIRSLEHRLSTRVYQSDFMTWHPHRTPRENLWYYIDTADSIHFSLRGVSREDLHLAMEGDDFLPYMTSHEIRYIAGTPALRDKTTWYLTEAAQRAAFKHTASGKLRKYRPNSRKLTDDEIMKLGFAYYGITGD